MISEKTIEENILKKANQKRLLSEVTIEGGNFTTAYLKERTLQDLFSEPTSSLEDIVAEAQRGREEVQKERELRKEREEREAVQELLKIEDVVEEKVQVEKKETVKKSTVSQVSACYCLLKHIKVTISKFSPIDSVQLTKTTKMNFIWAVLDFQLCQAYVEKVIFL